MATNKRNQSRDDQDQKGRENSQESRDSRQENQGNNNENRGNSQETQGNSDDNSSKPGFAATDDDKQREIASKGGEATHLSGHGFGSKEARKAGRKRSLL
ncbi:MAG: hypothetical protein JWR05_197 [Mucilaginibacter sp.]|nr:hypothetical protein [Mucilaginibacter sp.]